VTYSIVARDPVTGELGVAMQTAFLAAGSILPWARAGVGVVATQAFAEPAYGPRCLDALAAGASARDALDRAIAMDSHPAIRQVAVLGRDSAVAVMTGPACVEHAGHLIGEGFSVQANMMASAEVWPAMAEAYRSAAGSFPRRMLAALRAAQDAGGDARGVMSAALVVVAAGPSSPWEGRLLDLRVDRSDDPIGELSGLVNAAEAYDRFDRASDELSSGATSAALDDIDAGLALLPGDENLRFLRIGALLGLGDIDGARGELQELLAERSSWAIVVRSFLANGLVPVPPTLDVASLLP
jgi:uncharacterized Ntn-hydrolase superfamily protein